MGIPTKHIIQENKHQSVHDLRAFYERLLVLSKNNLLETTFESLEKELNINILVLHGAIRRLMKIGVIESFFNTKVYNKSDKRIFIGFAHPFIIDDLFREGVKK